MKSPLASGQSRFKPNSRLALGLTAVAGAIKEELFLRVDVHRPGK